VANSFYQFSSGQSGLPLWLCFHSLCHLSLCLDHRLWKDWAISNKELEHHSDDRIGGMDDLFMSKQRPKWYECQICVHIHRTLVFSSQGMAQKQRRMKANSRVKTLVTNRIGPAEIENVVELSYYNDQQSKDFIAHETFMEMISPARCNEAASFAANATNFAC